MSKQKILVVPSWYPSEKNPVMGIFFREQSALMADDFDVRVLAPEIIKNAKNPLKSLRFKVSKETSHPIVYRFPLYEYNWLPKRIAFKLKINQYIQAYKQLSKMDSWKPQLIHGHSTFYGGIWSYNISRAFGIPYLITEHSPLDMDIHKVVKQARYHALDALKNAKRVLAVSFSRRREIIWHLPSLNPGVIGNLVDENFFALREKNAQGPFRILIVAHASVVKDLATFFQMASILYQEFGNKVQFDVVGYNGWGGNNEEKVRSLASKWGVENACVFTGTVDRKSMVSCYHECHAFVLTSIAEGMPVSVLEALCTGTPVFSTRCGGVEEVVNETNGFISELKQPEALAEALSKAIRGEVNYNAYHMREAIVVKYGKQAFKKTVAKHYSDLISA